MRRLRSFPLEDLLLAQAVPGFLLAVGWTVMYEIYHEEGSYYTTLIQEILGTEGFFPYFFVMAVLMAFPLGLVIDSVRHVVGELWLGVPRPARLSGGVRSPADRQRGAPASPWQWPEQSTPPPETFEHRFALYRHDWATLLTPAKAAGNLALVLLVLGTWFLVRIVRMGGWHLFSPVFVIGTPLAGSAVVLVLLRRYTTGLGEFHRRVHESIFPSKGTPPPEAMEDTPLSPS